MDRWTAHSPLSEKPNGDRNGKQNIRNPRLNDYGLRLALFAWLNATDFNRLLASRIEQL